ncbi:hypothetical protein [Pseudomonas phage HU1]|nr:hypothetical protein [Pseudomonas phage HU1]
MNMFIHRALGHFLLAEEGGDSLLGGGGADTSATTTADTSTSADPLAAINSTKTVGELEAEQAAKDNAETPEAKLARETAEAKANEVPETYEAYKLPEGVQVDEALLGEFNTVAKELGLTQAQAQKLVDLQAKTAAAGETGREEFLAQALKTQSDAWVNEIKSDPELGGAKFDATVSTAVKAISTFFGDDFRQLLNDSGIGNNPALIRGMHKIGLAISEDKLVIPGSDASVTEDKRAADVMFGDVFKA